jgi:ferredoxin
MKVIVDRTRCEGWALCEAMAPDVFRVDERNFSEVVDANPSEALWDDVEAAVRDCPTQAIRATRD